MAIFSILLNYMVQKSLRLQAGGVEYSDSMSKALGCTGIALAALAVSACAQTSPEPATAPIVGMANPASVYCVKIGGKLRIERTEQGERGICVLPNGAEIDEWTLFRRDNPAMEQK